MQRNCFAVEAPVGNRFSRFREWKPGCEAHIHGLVRDQEESSSSGFWGLAQANPALREPTPVQRVLSTLQSLEEEMWSVNLSTALRKRFSRILQIASAHPDKSFPQMSESRSELEAVYRFFNNESVEPELLLEPHLEATLERCKQLGRVLAIHDTSGISYGGQETREGLGLLNDKGHGYYLHLTLLLSADHQRVPLGVGGYEALVREELSDPERNWREKRHDPGKEGLRWRRGIDRLEAHFQGSNTEIIHLLDREGDEYELLAQQLQLGRQFVIRLKYDRLLDLCHASPGSPQTPPRKVHEALAKQQIILKREVPLSSRRKNRSTEARKAHPARQARMATLAMSAATVRLKRPNSLAKVEGLASSIELNVLHVWEPHPPEGLEAVEWYLMTTLPIDSAPLLLDIVDYYRARWVIEEFFKALKTGCSIEKRQLESKDALLNVLALFLPIAHRLLLMRSLERTAPRLPASLVLSPLAIDILRFKRPKLRLPPKPTIAQAIEAVASLGGHIKSNGSPGWLVLGRGFEKLLNLQDGVLLARALGLTSYPYESSVES